MSVHIERPKRKTPQIKVSPLARFEEAIAAQAGKEKINETCEVCMEPITVQAILPCNHNMLCYKCVLVWKVLYKKFCCPLCKEDPEKIVLTALPNKRFGDFDHERLVLEKHSGCFIDPREAQLIAGVADLFKCECPFEGCDEVFPTLDGLKAHLDKRHGVRYCETCLRDRKVFLFEQKLFTPSELETHRKTWDGGIAEMEINEEGSAHNHRSVVLGHPLCRYCKSEFYGQDQLIEHMAQVHCTCTLCHDPESHDWIYFKGQRELRKHYRERHFPCNFPECVAKGYIVFRTQQELDAHIYAEHNSSLTSSEKMSLSRNFVGFHFESASESRRFRGGRGVGISSDVSDFRGADRRSLQQVYEERESTRQRQRQDDHGKEREKEPSDLEAPSVSPQLSINDADFPMLPGADSRQSTAIASYPERKGPKEEFPPLEGLKIKIKSPKPQPKGKTYAAVFHDDTPDAPPKRQTKKEKKEKAKEKAVAEMFSAQEAYRMKQEKIKKQKEERMNEQLQKERQERERREAAARLQRERELKERNEREERERAEREAKAKAEREQAERVRREKIERERKEQAEKEKAAAELKRQQEASTIEEELSKVAVAEQDLKEKQKKQETESGIIRMRLSLFDEGKQVKVKYSPQVLKKEITDSFEKVMNTARSFMRSQVSAEEYAETFFSCFPDERHLEATNIFLDLVSLIESAEKKSVLLNTIRAREDARCNALESEAKALDETKSKLVCRQEQQREEERKRKEQEEEEELRRKESEEQEARKKEKAEQESEKRRDKEQKKAKKPQPNEAKKSLKEKIQQLKTTDASGAKRQSASVTSTTVTATTASSSTSTVVTPTATTQVQQSTKSAKSKFSLKAPSTVLAVPVSQSMEEARREAKPVKQKKTGWKVVDSSASPSTWTDNAEFPALVAEPSRGKKAKAQVAQKQPSVTPQEPPQPMKGWGASKKTASSDARPTAVPTRDSGAAKSSPQSTHSALTAAAEKPSRSAAQSPPAEYDEEFPALPGAPLRKRYTPPSKPATVLDGISSNVVVKPQRKRR